MPYLSLRPVAFFLLAVAGTQPCLSAHAAPPALFEAPSSTWKLSHGSGASLGPVGEASPAASPLGLRPSPSARRYQSTDNGFFDREARFASGAGNVLFLAAGTLLPLAEDGPEGKQHAIRTVDSLVTSTLITEALKRIVRERRPDGSSRTSFPSGHATAAFAVAAMQANFHPRQAPLWYAGASIIAASRVQLDRHYVQDVVAGAAVGYFTSRFELKSRRGILLRPFISPGSGEGAHADRGAVGLSVGGTF